jgi:hypothetical protein
VIYIFWDFREEDEVNNDFDKSNMRYYIYFSRVLTFFLWSYWVILSVSSSWLLVLNIICQYDVKHMTLRASGSFDLTKWYCQYRGTDSWYLTLSVMNIISQCDVKPDSWYWTLSVSVMSNLTLGNEHYQSVWCQTWLLVLNIISQCDVKPDSWYWTLSVSVMFSTKSQVWHHTDW